MTTIQRYPAGLLELFGAKSGGENPSQLGQVVVQTVDILQALGLGNVTEQNDGGATVAGAGQVITVPETEWWLVYNASVRVAVSATQTGLHASLGLSTRLESPARVSLAWGALPDAAIAGTSCTIAVWTPPQPMLAPPGTTFWGVLEALGTDANAVLGVQVRYSVLG